MSRRARVWLVIVALMGMYSGWPLGAVEAQVYEWASLRAADFPAFVQAIVFATGNELKSGSSWRWGQWTVRFGDNRPVARLTDCDRLVCPRIEIENLECTNPVVGRSPCLMGLMVVDSDNGKEAACWVGILNWKELGLVLRSSSWGIPCPVRVIFAS